MIDVFFFFNRLGRQVEVGEVVRLDRKIDLKESFCNWGICKALKLI